MDHHEYILTHRLADSDGFHESHDSMADHLDKLTPHADVLHDSHVHSFADAKIAATQRPARRRAVRLKGHKDLFHEHHKELDHKNVILEPRVVFTAHQVDLHLLAGGRFLAPESLPPREQCIKVVVLGNEQPLAHAEVTLMYLDGDGNKQMLPQVKTDAEGYCDLHFGADCKPLVIGGYPACGYWSAFERNPGDHVVLECVPLDEGGPLGWWHTRMGVEKFDRQSGQSVRVGIIGTGVAKHPNLSHVVRLDGKLDLSSHGTHVCGLIASRPRVPGEYGGMVPGAAVFTQRVFELDDKGQMTLPDQTVLSHAIDEFAGHGHDPANRVDLINLSLGSRKRSEVVRDSIVNAYQAGTLCVCSAGNTSNEVEYPAALPETVGVSGLGVEEWGPENSVTAFMTPPDSQPERFGKDGMYLAMFSCFGETLSCAAPGNGIISTVTPLPENDAPYAVMDGTSLSSPLVCGLLARLLSENKAIQDMPLDGNRSRAITQMLEKHCEQAGLNPQFEGAGLPEYSPLPSPMRTRISSKRGSARKGSSAGKTRE
ncbi:MAG: S8 family serine peptidase [Pirellulaceae bacterium]